LFGKITVGRMKVFIALVALVASTYAIDVSQVSCGATNLVYTGGQDDFPRFAGGEIKLGACVLGDDFYLDADYNVCGLTKTIDGDLIELKAQLVSDAPSGMITRRKVVAFSLSCTYNRKDQQMAGAQVTPVIPTITGDVTQVGDTVNLFLDLLDASGNVVASGNDLVVEVGKTVTAVVGGTQLEALGLNAYATSCYITPDADAGNALQWSLLEDNCAKDSTFAIAGKGRGQSMSFESFAFNADTNAKLYLHCDLKACNPSDGCGECSKRKRREAMFWSYKAVATATVTKTMKVEM